MCRIVVKLDEAAEDEQQAEFRVPLEAYKRLVFLVLTQKGRN